MGEAIGTMLMAIRRTARRWLGMDRPPPDYRRHDRALVELRQARDRLARTRRLIAVRSGNVVADLATGTYRPQTQRARRDGPR